VFCCISSFLFLFRHKHHFKQRLYLHLHPHLHWQPLLHLPTTSSATRSIFMACSNYISRAYNEQWSLQNHLWCTKITLKSILVHHKPLSTQPILSCCIIGCVPVFILLFLCNRSLLSSNFSSCGFFQVQYEYPCCCTLKGPYCLSFPLPLIYLSYSTWQPVCSSTWRLDLSSAWRPNSSILPDILSVLCLAAKSFAWRPEFLYAWPPDLLWAWQVEHPAGNQVYLVLVYLFCSYLTEEIGKLSCSVLAVIFSAFSDINITFSFDLTCINIYSASTPTPTSAHHSIYSYIYNYTHYYCTSTSTSTGLRQQSQQALHNIFLPLHPNMPLHLHLHPHLQECW